MIEKEQIQVAGKAPNIKLEYNLYPEIKLIIDRAKSSAQDNKAFKIFTESFDVSECASNIRFRTVLDNQCGQLTCDLLHEDCYSFQEGDRVRLYLDNVCRFCGFIFTREFKPTKMSITCFDFLRYFKAPLYYDKSMMMNASGTQGMTASEIFTKICTDLAIPNSVINASTIPVPAKRWTEKTAFNILENAISETIVNSPETDRQYYTYFHEPNIGDEEQFLKTSGTVEFHLRNELTTNIVITDADLISDYDFSTSIDKQTYNDIILYSRKKTYLSKTGKTLKNGRLTGTVVTRTYDDIDSKGLWGYLPFVKEVPDSYNEAQMDKVGKELLKVFNRKTQSIKLECYGILGMRAGYLVPVKIPKIGGTFVGKEVKDEETGEITVKPVYRTVKSCEFKVEHPLKMSLEISSAENGEFDV